MSERKLVIAFLTLDEKYMWKHDVAWLRSECLHCFIILSNSCLGNRFPHNKSKLSLRHFFTWGSQECTPNTVFPLYKRDRIMTKYIWIDKRTDPQHCLSSYLFLVILPVVFSSNYHINSLHTQTQCCLFKSVSQAWLLWIWVIVQPSIVHLSACRLSSQLVPAGLEKQIGQAWMSQRGQVGPAIRYRNAHWHRLGLSRSCVMGHVWRRREGGILSHVYANPDKLDKASSG